MNFGWLKPALIKLQKGIVKNAPHILMGIGTAETITAMIFVAKAAPAAKEAVREAKEEKRAEGPYPAKLTFWEWLKAVAKYYGPGVAQEILALICFWAAHGINVHRQMVLAGICTTTEQLLQEYQKKVQELLGEKTEKEVRNSLAQDFVDQNPPPKTAYYLDGSTQRQFVYRGQYFPSSYLKIGQAENQANHELIHSMYLSETELMWLLDPERKHLKPAYDSGEVGWNVDNLMHLEINWATDPGTLEPIGVIEVVDTDGMRYPPKPGYSQSL